MLFAGCLGRNALHSHSAPVLLTGLYDDFHLKLGRGTWFSCRAAIIQAGDVYEFDAGGRPLAVVYVEPTETSAEGLAALIHDSHEEQGALIGARCDLDLLRTLYEDSASLAWADEALADLIGFSKAKVGARREIDVRVLRAIAAIADPERAESELTGAPSVAAAADAARLSTSRFQHLFKQETGVSYRRYAAWTRMRVAVAEVVKGENFTNAAHAAGYYDQPHFAHEFRRIFGAPASKSLAGVRSLVCS